MYYEYWGMNRHPFDNVPDPTMYFRAHESVETAVAEVLFAIEEGDEVLAVIVGEVGLGKTIEAGMILRKHLNPFVKLSELGNEISQAESAMRPKIESPADARARELKEKLEMSISALDPSVRATHCLEAEGIKMLSELVERTEADMLKIRNFGKTSLRELKKKLEEMGLSFGMQVPA